MLQRWPVLIPTRQDLPDKFCFEHGPLAAHFGAHFIPKTKSEMVRQLLREEDEQKAAEERARARRASGIMRVEMAAARRGRRRSSLALAFALPGVESEAGIKSVQGPSINSRGGLAVRNLDVTAFLSNVGSPVCVSQSRAAERWMKPEDEMRYAQTSLSLDPHPPVRASITHDPIATHGFEVERKKELDERDKEVWRMWQGSE